MDTEHQAVKEFTTWVAVNPLPGKHRRGSENTIKGYTRDLERFASWFKQSRGFELGPETLTPDDIQDYITYAQTVEEKKPATILRYFAAIRAYALYLKKTDDRITSDLTDGIRLPRQEPAAKQGLRRLERLAVVRALNVPWKKTEKAKHRLIRDRAIVFTLMFVGLRIDELENVRLKHAHIIRNSTNSYIEIPSGKGNQYRSVGVPKKARDALAEWLDLREKLGAQHDYLFVQIRNEYKPLGKRTMQSMIEKVGRKAEIEGLSPHILRHTAVRIWRNEAGDRAAAAQMGHSIATMQKYDSLRDGDLIEAAGKF